MTNENPVVEPYTPEEWEAEKQRPVWYYDGEQLERMIATIDRAFDECLWAYDEIDDKWDTACGEAYQFMVDGPEENNYRHCPGCGRRIRREA